MPITQSYLAASAAQFTLTGPTGGNMGDLDDIVKEFLIESTEGLDQLDRDLVALEADPSNQELLAGVFRCIHTIKGTCGFLGFSKLESVTHAGEGLLSRLRRGDLVLTADLTTALLATVDAVREVLSAIETRGDEGDGDYGDLVAELEALKGARARDAGTPAPPQTPSRSSGKAGSGLTDQAIRVDVSQLDDLMTLVGELVLARNQIVQSPALQADGALRAAAQDLDLLTSELQAGVMKTRMQPIGSVWSKFPRLVRDLGAACGKQVRIQFEGHDTELDKSLVEAIRDPLTHVIRNAVDHGIESAAVRRDRSKPPEGLITVRAFHEGGQVRIDVIDDGGGVDIARVKAKAVQLGIVTAADASRMSEAEAVQLLFSPGFSTTDTVTNVSGRGVGMDVVKTNIERIGGDVEVTTNAGEGTGIRVRIPLTLAIIPALVVHVATQRFAIPQGSVLELVRLTADDVPTAIEDVHGAPVYRLREQLLPLVFLDRALACADASVEREGQSVNIVVVQTGHRPFGLVVDMVSDTTEIVVKPLSAHLKSIPVYAGATIMGDGRIVLILDVPALAQRAGLAAEHGGQTMPEISPSGVAQELRRQVLLCGTAGDARIAIPLARVTRLEEFPRSAVERTGTRDVVRYRGSILPLVDVGAALGGTAANGDGDRVWVVVHSVGDRSVGLVVGRILDVVEIPLDVIDGSDRDGVVGSVVVGERVTELLDTDRVAALCAPCLSGAPRGTRV